MADIRSLDTNGTRPLDLSVEIEQRFWDVIEEFVGRDVPIAMMVGVITIVQHELIRAHSD